MLTNLLVKCALAIAALAFAGCSSGGRKGPPQSLAHDPPLLVVDRSIGAVRLNITRAAVERRYGKPARLVVFRSYFPVGTRYHGKKLGRAVYHLHGGVLQVDYVDGKVKAVETTSTYYRSVRRIGVGARLPRDRCMRLDEIGHTGPRGCKNTWRGFDFDGECLDAWLNSTSAKAMTVLYMHSGRRVETVRIGEPDVILPCF